jgi:hypothetical protein
MKDGRTTGEILRAILNRADLSVREFAIGAGYRHGSGVQRYIEPEFDGAIKLDVAKRMADALEGKGEPPVSRGEVLALVGVDGVFEAEVNTELAPRYQNLPRDVPVYGTALGTFTENEVIEQTIVDRGEPLDYLLRPAGVVGRQGVYGLYVTGESQSPRFKPGEIVFVDPKRAPMIGDDVVVFLRKEEDDGEALAAVLLKELVRRGHNRIELRQLNPHAEFSIDARRVSAIHRVLTNADLYGGYR